MVLATSGMEVKVPSTMVPLLVVDLGGQVDGDGAAQRMAEDVARAVRVAARRASPRRRVRPRTPCLPRAGPACSCRSRGSRWPAPRSPAPACGACAARSPRRSSVRRAGTASPGRRRHARLAAQPQAVQLDRLAGDLGLELDPDVVHVVAPTGPCRPSCGRWAGRSRRAAARRGWRSPWCDGDGEGGGGEERSSVSCLQWLSQSAERGKVPAADDVQP